MDSEDDALAGSSMPPRLLEPEVAPLPTRASLRRAEAGLPPEPPVAPAVAPAFGGAAPAALRAAPAASAPAPVAAAAPIPAPITLPPEAVAPVPEPVLPAAAPVAATSSRPDLSASPGFIDPRRPLLPGGGPEDDVDEEQLARSTVLERVLFVLAFALPPIGLIGSIVAAIRSDRRRGWVITLLKAGIAVGVVFSVLAAAGGYAGYKVLRQQQAHDQTVAASAAFCAAFVKGPTLAAADGGWPQPAATVADSVTAMQAFVTRWKAVAAVSPAGIQSGVTGIASAGSEVIDSVNTQHTIDDTSNRQSMQSAVTASGVADWRAEYCG